MYIIQNGYHKDWFALAIIIIIIIVNILVIIIILLLLTSLLDFVYT